MIVQDQKVVGQGHKIAQTSYASNLQTVCHETWNLEGFLWHVLNKPETNILPASKYITLLQ